MKNPIDRDGYDVGEFAERHGISRSQTYNEINSGRLVARKVGSRTIITREDAERWRKSLPRFPIDGRAGPSARQREAEQSALPAGTKRRRGQQPTSHV